MKLKPKVLILTGMLALAGNLSAQLPQIENSVRNVFSEAGVPPDPEPPGPTARTGNQFESGTVFGGWQATRIKIDGTIVAGSTSEVAGTPGTILSPSFTPLDLDGETKLTNQTIQLVGVKMSRTMVVQLVSFSMGSEILRPNRKPDGSVLDPKVFAEAEFYFKEPANSSTGRFYWSPHAERVFATEPGVITIDWKERVTGNSFTQTYNVSGSPVKQTKTIYWTERDFNGPPVQVPESRVGDVNIAYNSLFLKEVAESNTFDFDPENPYDPQNPGLNLPPEVRTLWFDSLDNSIHAYNIEGRVFVEFLGDLREPDRIYRDHLGFEIVDVIQETRPEELKVSIGEKVSPTDNDESLKAVVIKNLSDQSDPYLFEHLSLGGTKRTLYAIRETSPFDLDGDGPLPEQQSNEVLIYWTEEGVAQLFWPKEYVGYIFKWPEEYRAATMPTPTIEELSEFYSIYARPEGSDASIATGVQLNSVDNPVIAYQDDPTRTHAKLTPQNVFYTVVSPSDPTGRALIRYTIDEEIWFERVFSILQSEIGSFDGSQIVLGTFDENDQFSTGYTNISNVSLADPDTGASYAITTDYTINLVTGIVTKTQGGAISETARVSFENNPFTALVGTRVNAPSNSSVMVGHIREEFGNAYNPGAYFDPFTHGFEQAGNGVIIPVNALPGNDELVIWWYAMNQPISSTFSVNHWPRFVIRYKLQWPVTDPDDGNLNDEIILARNDGSGELGIAATGSIYRQADPQLPGYNPNEEHALMSGGVAYVLRDDLNIPTSSQPYVLVDYTAEDDLPAMVIRRVVRENTAHTFDYEGTVGAILQAPLPLPLIQLPVDENNIVRNREVGAPTDVPANFAPNSEGIEHYDRFTYVDRKGSTWIYRGPHADGVNVGTVTDQAKSFVMHYFYKTQAEFDFPGLTKPDVGTIVPYLRPFTNGMNAAGGFNGDPITGIPADVVFTPIWPSSPPILNISESLALPKRGLPAVRGQTSMRVLYQQSIGGDVDEKTPSLRLFDPTRKKTFALSESGLDKLPDSLVTSDFLGKTYFPNLPPHLSQRLFFDPNIGPLGSLVFIGEFIDAPFGEDYFLLNVMSAKDVTDSKALVAVGGSLESQWHTAIDGLSTTLETFIEDPKRKGVFVVNPALNTQAGPTQLAEVNSENTAVDSYAVTAIGGGTGYVVLASGDGAAFTPPAEPVSLHVFKVDAPLYRGELKIVQSANPLDEKLNLRHSGDYAGDPADFEFAWLKAQPVAGFPPVIYTFAALTQPIVGNGSWQLFNNPADTIIAQFRAVDFDDSGEGWQTVNLPAQQITINDGAGNEENGVSIPYAVLRREFIQALPLPFEAFLSIDLENNDGVVVYVNGTEAVVWNVPNRENSVATTPPGDINSLERVFRIMPEAIVAGDNTVTVELYTLSDVNSQSTINLRLEGRIETVDLSGWQDLTDGAKSGDGVVAKSTHTIEGATIETLTDNYFTMRYRAKAGTAAAFATSGNAITAGNWSSWLPAQLAPGWIKRVLGGINPFEQRVTDLFNNNVNTDVSLLTQAGPRWEGDIALNLQNIDDFGLIEIYETVLRRGKSLSISGNPPLNVPAANDALLLAAGYLNDLYQLLGNEAFADASNPTIAFDTEGGDFGEFNTALFAFKGQLATVLDEELALLRGRDDNLQPGVVVSPVYNRLVWNFTGGINSGEPIYSLNYNIQDLNVDGAADAVDATVQFPQGHGDAYGHYLTALKVYYTLLSNDHFSWTPRVEAVSVLGQPVSIDYQDERKFASAAAALTRTANQVLDLTYRQQFTANENAGWTHLRDGDTNDRTGTTRRWGTDEWASRSGQGAYFHWVTANSILPEEDNVNEGIEKVDRTTVPELDEVVGDAKLIQITLDNADARLNPLGLAKGAVSFDISPNEIDAGKTHYEQVYDRAVGALKNAVFAFNNAKSSTEFLRQQDNSIAENRAAIDSQLTAFENKLIGIYGTPYPDDIGPGKTYSQGYTGPDLLHFAYVETPELFFDPTLESREYELFLDPEFADANSSTLNLGESVMFTINAKGDVVKPATWTGRRAHPGQMQSVISDLLSARQRLRQAMDNYENLKDDMNALIDLYDAEVTARTKAVSLTSAAHDKIKEIENSKLALSIVKRTSDIAAEIAIDASDGAAEFFPTTLGFSNDATSPGRGAAKLIGVGIKTALLAASSASEADLEKIDSNIVDAERLLEVQLEEAFWDAQSKQLIQDLHDALSDFRGLRTAVDQALRVYDQAQRNFQEIKARGFAVQAARETFNKRAAAIVQGFRTRDLAFRVFRDESLEKYSVLFNLAARYTFLAARAYDYETGLLHSSGNSVAASFFNSIVQSRALGVVDKSGNPQFTASNTGDPGLSGVLAQMEGDWSVAKTRLGFNNPDRYRTKFSLRGENFRIIPAASGDGDWSDKLAASRMSDVLEDPDVRRYCMQIADQDGLPVPGLVIPFQTTIAQGFNFFGEPLAGGDHGFSPSTFATKIRSSGIAFKGYVGMDSPTSTGGTLSEIGASSPADPDLGFLDPDALSATPHIYLIPTGVDSMRSPPLGDVSTVRSWSVDDQAIPLPFNIGNTDFSTNTGFLSSDSLSEEAFAIRKHQAFRAVPSGTVFSSAPGFTNSRLIGRSVWNSRWKIVIPGSTLRSNPQVGLQIFIESVKDIELYLETYSYSGN